MGTHPRRGQQVVLQADCTLVLRDNVTVFTRSDTTNTQHLMLTVRLPPAAPLVEAMMARVRANLTPVRFSAAMVVGIDDVARRATGARKAPGSATVAVRQWLV